MYKILDLTKNPPSIISDLQFETEKEAFVWINENGGITMYSVVSSL